MYLLSQFVNQPRKPQMDIAIKVLKYLKGTPSQGLFVLTNNDLKMIEYSNID